MSNIEVAPTEILCRREKERGPATGRLRDARLVPLGGPRAMTVRRTLPQRERSLIGAWCFVGGAPLGEQIVMWWNFIERSHEEIATYRGEWQQARLGAEEETRFGPFPDQWNSTLAAPALPNARLKLRA